MIRSARTGLVQVLTLDRHEQRNALNAEMVEGLINALDEAQRGGSRCVVITGAGSSFCAGADLAIVGDEAFRASMYNLLHRISELPMPVLAAVNGPAIGAGTQLAISCDLRVADLTARFMVPTARLGLAVDPWSVRRLVSLAGGGATRAMLLGLDTISAERAYGLGMVDRIGTLNDALEWAQTIAALAPLALQYSKLAVNAATQLNINDADASQALARTFASDDAREALQARREGRSPVFQGR